MKKAGTILLLGLALFLVDSCRKKSERAPVVTTSVVSAGAKEASCSGVVYFEGDSKITEKGIVWGVSPDIDENAERVIVETEGQTFTALIAGLELNTTYYARAYAVNEFGVALGKVVSFKTLKNYYPSLNFLSLMSVSTNSASMQLYLSQVEPASYTLGMCWSRSELPTVQDSVMTIMIRKSNDPIPFNTYVMPELENLTESTQYFVRAFASNSLGVVYSSQVVFTTKTPENPVTFSVISVGHTSVSTQVSLSNAVAPSEVQAVGVCWSQGALPTIANEKTEGPYNYFSTFNVSTLEANTGYFMRAYVVTASKVIYSALQRVFRTYKGTVTDINGNEYPTVEIGGVEWMASNYRASSFNDGTSIPLVTNYNAWANNSNNLVPMYGYYAGNPSYNVPYGKYYPQYVAENPKLPPPGWHVATSQDWQNMLSYAQVVELCVNNGSWGNDPTINNYYNFSLYAGGHVDGGWGGLGQYARFWAPSGSTSPNAIQFTAFNAYSLTWYPRYNGFNVRCVKDP